MVDPALEQAVQGEMDLLRSDVRSNRGRLEELLDDEFVEIGASGRLWQRSALIDDLLSSATVDLIAVDVVARHVGDRIVLVTYKTDTGDRRILRSSWWRETEGGWRCFFHQGTVSLDNNV